MEKYNKFLSRIGEFQLPDMDLGKSYFKGKPSLTYKIDDENQLKDFFGDTVVFELDEETKTIIGGIIDEIYEVARLCFAERLHNATLHMTLHDLSNSPRCEDVEEEMARNLEEIKKCKSRFGKRVIKMRTNVIFNMVNTSLVLGLVPADEEEHIKLMELYDIFDGILEAKYPLTPHITLAYFTPSGFGDEAKARLEAAVNEINLDSQFEIILDTKKLHYQHFFSMNDYRNIIDFE